jgi:DNA-binding transcriptional MerR regulator
MQIKDIARATGLDTETIRFYEKQGLLSAPPRLENGYRDYGPQHLERLSFIRHCRALDMPLADIGRLLALAECPPDDCSDVNQLVDAQLGRVRARLHSMRALEKQLLQLRRQCASPRSGQSCGILGELVAAAHAEACACHGAAAG